MKRIIAVIAVMIMVFAVGAIGAEAATYSGSCGENVGWSLDTITGELSITGNGAMKNYSYFTNAPWQSYSKSIKKAVIEKGITSIGEYAFNKCSNLTSVTIPDSVTNIGSRAFYGCKKLIIVTIPDSMIRVDVGAF